MKTATAKDVHNEFDQQAESTLKQANRIIDASKKKDNILIMKMKQLGFGNSESIKENASAIKNANLTLSHKLLYPQNNFLTETVIEAICKKYGLLMASSSDFIGEIPVKNQMEITNFKLADEHVMISCIDRKKFGENLPKIKNLRKKSKSISGIYLFDVAKIFSWFEIMSLKSEYEKTISKKEFQKGNSNLSFRKEVASEFLIVATPENFNLENKEIIGQYKVIDKDPVVLCKVDGGYLQVSAWGDETELDEFKTATKN